MSIANSHKKPTTLLKQLSLYCTVLACAVLLLHVLLPHHHHDDGICVMQFQGEQTSASEACCAHHSAPIDNDCSKSEDSALVNNCERSAFVVPSHHFSAAPILINLALFILPSNDLRLEPLTVSFHTIPLRDEALLGEKFFCAIPLRAPPVSVIA